MKSTKSTDLRRKDDGFVSDVVVIVIITTLTAPVHNYIVPVATIFLFISLTNTCLTVI